MLPVRKLTIAVALSTCGEDSGAGGKDECGGNKVEGKDSEPANRRIPVDWQRRASARLESGREMNRGMSVIG